MELAQEELELPSFLIRWVLLGMNIKMMIKAGGEVKKECHPSTTHLTAEVGEVAAAGEGHRRFLLE